jgi:FtsH-binding integral membrane protein
MSIHDPNVMEQVKAGADALSVVAVIGALSGLLPAIAALFTIIWTGLRIYESETVQKWLAKRRNSRKAD